MSSVNKLEYLLSLAPDISILDVADSYLHRDETQSQTIVKSGIFFFQDHLTAGVNTNTSSGVFHKLKKTRALLKISFDELKGSVSDNLGDYQITIRNLTDPTRDPLVYITVSPDKNSFLVLYEAFDYNNEIEVRNTEKESSEEFFITGVMF